MAQIGNLAETLVGFTKPDYTKAKLIAGTADTALASLAPVQDAMTNVSLQNMAAPDANERASAATKKQADTYDVVTKQYDPDEYTAELAMMAGDPELGGDPRWAAWGQRWKGLNDVVNGSGKRAIEDRIKALEEVLKTGVDTVTDPAVPRQISAEDKQQIMKGIDQLRQTQEQARAELLKMNEERRTMLPKRDELKALAQVAETRWRFRDKPKPDKKGGGPYTPKKNPNKAYEDATKIGAKPFENMNDQASANHYVDFRNSLYDSTSSRAAENDVNSMAADVWSSTYSVLSGKDPKEAGKVAASRLFEQRVAALTGNGTQIKPNSTAYKAIEVAVLAELARDYGSDYGFSAEAITTAAYDSAKRKYGKMIENENAWNTSRAALSQLIRRTREKDIAGGMYEGASSWIEKQMDARVGDVTGKSITSVPGSLTRNPDNARAVANEVYGKMVGQTGPEWEYARETMKAAGWRMDKQSTPYAQWLKNKGIKKK